MAFCTKPTKADGMHSVSKSTESTSFLSIEKQSNNGRTFLCIKKSVETKEASENYFSNSGLRAVSLNIQYSTASHWNQCYFDSAAMIPANLSVGHSGWKVWLVRNGRRNSRWKQKLAKTGGLWQGMSGCAFHSAPGAPWILSMIFFWMLKQPYTHYLGHLL